MRGLILRVCPGRLSLGLQLNGGFATNNSCHDTNRPIDKLSLDMGRRKPGVRILRRAPGSRPRLPAGFLRTAPSAFTSGRGSTEPLRGSERATDKEPGRATPFCHTPAMMPTDRPPPPQKTLWFIFFTVVLDTTGHGIIFPILPDLLESLGLDSIADAALWGGVLATSYALMQFLFSPIMGNLSDAYGRRPVILLALTGMAIDYVILGLATVLWLLLVGRLVAGAMGGTVSTATAYLADISRPEDRVKNFGLIGAAFGLGFILGPALGGLLGEVDLRAPFFMSAALAGLNFLFGWFVLPESLPRDRRRPFSRTALNPFASIDRAFSMTGLRTALSCFFIISVAHQVYPAIWSFWAREALGWSVGLIGLSLAVYGAGVVIVQGGVIRMPVVSRLGAQRVVALSLGLGIFSLVGLGFASAGWVVFAILPFSSLSDLLNPTLTGFMANRVPDNEQGALQGVLASITAVTAIVSPLVMTAIFRATAGPEARLYFPGSPYLVSAFLLALTLPPLWRTMRAAESPPPSSPSDLAGSSAI